MGGRFVVSMAVLLAVGCGGGPGDATEATDATADTGPTDDLAPSQVTAVTAPPPDTPPPCDPASIGVWTAQVVHVDGWADAVLRLRNDGEVRCEIDVGGSPLVDPLMEPDVWLDPGAWADLVLGPDSDDCADGAVVRLAQLDVNGEQVVVETAAVVPCGWWLTAFYPNSSSDEPCRDLRAVVVAGAVLVRNDGSTTCLLGALVDVDGSGVVLEDPDANGLALPLLAAGDVVAVALERRGGDAPSRPIVLGFDSGVAVEVDVDGGEVLVGAGPPGPWIGGPGSPARDDPPALLEALDPFTADR